MQSKSLYFFSRLSAIPNEYRGGNLFSEPAWYTILQFCIFECSLFGRKKVANRKDFECLVIIKEVE